MDTASFIYSQLMYILHQFIPQCQAVFIVMFSAYTQFSYCERRFSRRGQTRYPSGATACLFHLLPLLDQKPAPLFLGPGCEPALFLSGISPVEVLFRQLSSIAKTTGKASGMSRAYYGQYPFRGMVYVLISLLSVNKSMYFETYLIPNVVLFQLYVPLYLLFISTHCVIVTV